jgi:hypothetical protein
MFLSFGSRNDPSRDGIRATLKPNERLLANRALLYFFRKPRRLRRLDAPACACHQALARLINPNVPVTSDRARPACEIQFRKEAAELNINRKTALRGLFTIP